MPDVIHRNITTTPAVSVSGGASVYRNLDLGTTGQIVKDVVGQVYGYYISNRSNVELFLKFYDKATAPTSADTPLMTYPIPANTSAHRSIDTGVVFTTGISVRGTTGIADNNNVAPGTNELVVNIEYK